MSTKNPLIQYYEVLNNSTIYHLDDMRRVAFPEKSENNKVLMTRKGQYVKSFGVSGKYKTHKGKLDLLTLVNGVGVDMADLRLYADEVDDCGCDGNPVAKPSDLEKLNAAVNDHEPLDKDSAFVGSKSKSKFNKWAVIGFFIGAIAIGTCVWFKTKDKKKALISAAIGAFIGLVIGYFAGRGGGEKEEGTVDTLDDVEKDAESSFAEVAPVESPKPEDKADSKSFLQLGKSYDFALPNAIYAMVFSNDTFYVAKDKQKKRVVLNAGEVLKGKLIEVAEPQFFLPGVKSRKVQKIKSKKPLPFLDLGNKLYMPLSAVDPKSIINTEEAMNFMDGIEKLDQEIYIKGRYAGKRMFNLMYMPSHESAIRSRYGKKS